MEEEILVLESIYGENLKIDLQNKIIEFYEEELHLTFLLPELYPLNYADIDFSIKLSGSKSEFLYKTLRNAGNNVINNKYKDEVEEEEGEDIDKIEGILWSLIEAIRESWQQFQNDNIHEEEENDRINGDESVFTNMKSHIPNKSIGIDIDEELAKKIVHGEPILFKKSTFQAHLCPVHSLQDVAMFKAILLMNNKIKRATHNISAYRFINKSNNNNELLYHDCDDDGEHAAGGRLAEIMRLMNTQNVCVVVSRWFGGVLLGPDRFKCINNAGRTLLEQCGYDKKKGKKEKKSSIN